VSVGRRRWGSLQFFDVSRITRHSRSPSDRQSAGRIRDDPCTPISRPDVSQMGLSQMGQSQTGQSRRTRRPARLVCTGGVALEVALEVAPRDGSSTFVRSGSVRFQACHGYLSIRSRVHARPCSRRQGEGPTRFQLDTRQPPAPWQIRLSTDDEPATGTEDP
jgi:hypothetical protein